VTTPNATAGIKTTAITTEETVYTLSDLTLNHLHALNIVWKEWQEKHCEDWSYVGQEVRRLMQEMAEAMQEVYKKERNARVIRNKRDGE